MKALVIAVLVAAAAPPPLAVRDRAFVVTDLETGQIVRNARSVPNRPGTICYDWVVIVAPQQRVVEAVETFVLPAPAPWNLAESDDTKVAADQTRAVTHVAEDLSDGRITHGWCVAAGDPPGDYRIEVAVDGAKIATFAFVLLPAADTI